MASSQLPHGHDLDRTGVAISTSVSVVITPSALSDAWMDQVEKAAARAGLTVAVTEDASNLGDAPPDLIIISNPLTAADSHGLGVSEASRMLAHAAFFSQRSVNTLTDASFTASAAASDQGPLPFLEAPPDRPRHSTRPGDPLAIYETGAPAAGIPFPWSFEIFALDPKATLLDSHVEIELVGRARYLVHGPYFWLTPGRWKAILEFGVDEGATDRRFRAEWGGPTGHTDLPFTPTCPGRYSVELEYDFTEPSACELRLVLTESVLSGTLHLYNVEVELLSPTIDTQDGLPAS